MGAARLSATVGVSGLFPGWTTVEMVISTAKEAAAKAFLLIFLLPILRARSGLA